MLEQQTKLCSKEGENSAKRDIFELEDAIKDADKVQKEDKKEIDRLVQVLKDFDVKPEGLKTHWTVVNELYSFEKIADLVLKYEIDDSATLNSEGVDQK